MERILLVMAAADQAEASESLRTARANAHQAETLSVGLLLPSLPAETPEAADVRILVGTDLWRQAVGLWRGETFILLTTPFARFEQDWDLRLTREADRWQRRLATGAVLTGCLPREADLLRAVCPVAADAFDPEGRLALCRGVPLRYAAESESGAFISPSFCFARAGFFRDVAESAEAPFWTAFRKRWAVYTLHDPVAWLVTDDPLPAVTAAEDPELRQRFARHFGVDFDTRTLSAKAREGIWRNSLEAPVKVPWRIRMQERIRGWNAGMSKLTPLAVTGRLADAPGEDPPEQQMVRFRRLCALRDLPLVCYADRTSWPQIAKLGCNVIEYQRENGLPGAQQVKKTEAEAWFRLSKPFLLASARDRDPNRSHYVWIDFDYLRYPVYGKTALDWQVICGDRITVGWVDGHPDPSMFCVPEMQVLPLCRDFSALCAAAVARTGSLPRERAVWERIIRDQPQRFETVELPAGRELFSLTMPIRGEEW